MVRLDMVVDDKINKKFRDIVHKIMDKYKKQDAKMNVSHVSKYIRNFLFPTLRENQSYILSEIDAAFASGYKHIILEIQPSRRDNRPNG
jgi:hypothetical protein